MTPHRPPLKRLLRALLIRLPGVRAILETRGTGCPVNHRYFFFQKVLGFNRQVPWPVHFTSRVTGAAHIKIGLNTAPGASIGNYIFASAEAPIEVGSYTVIASNVCIGAFNHDPYNISRYVSKGGIRIGAYCWVGANAVILSGVQLGDHTVVAAGAVVTRSFPEGCCIVGGNPARVIKTLDPARIERFAPAVHYHGYRRVGAAGAGTAPGGLTQPERF
jgi:acetyltransferase-like isoleucine patch superfamily enzyme